MNNTKPKKSRIPSNGQQSYRLSRTQYSSNRYQHSNNNSQNQSTFTPSSGMVGGAVPLSGNGSINGNSHGNDGLPRKAVYANAPFLSVVGTQLGNLVQIQTRSGTLWEGILKTFSPDFDIVIEIAAQLDASRKLNIVESITDVMIFKACDIVNIVAKNCDFKEVNGAALLTDSEIARFNGQIRTTVRELEPWIDPEKANGVETDIYLEDEAEKGWDAEKMFKRNEEIGVENDFDEDMPGYMVTIDRKDTEEFKREEDIAAKIAAKLENNSNLYHNKVNIDNTDEEEEFAAVARPPPPNMKYILNNGTSSGGEKNYQPPRRLTYNAVNNKTSQRTAANVNAQMPSAKFETKTASKYVYNTSNSNYNQQSQSQHIGSDTYKPLPLRPSSTFHNKSNMTSSSSLTKTSVSPPLPATQTHQHKNQHRRSSPPNSETSTDDSKSSSMSTSSPPQRSNAALRVHTTSINVMSNSVSVNVSVKPDSDEREVQKSASATFVPPSTKQRADQAEEPKKSRQIHETVEVQLVVEDPKKDDVGPKLTEGSHPLSLRSPTLPSTHSSDKKKSADIEDSNILKSSNLNPNAKEFVFKSTPVPTPATVTGTTETSVQPGSSPSMVAVGQRTVPVPSVVSQSSSSDLSRSQSPTPITHILPMAAPMQQLVALPPQSHPHQGHGHGHGQGQGQLHPQQHVPYVFNSGQPNIYFTTQPIYQGVMSQPHPSNPNGSNNQHFSKPRGNKGHHNIRENNMAAVAATGQPLVVSPASVPQYIYQQPAGMQGQCFAPFQTIRMCPQESNSIQQMQYFPSPPPMHPSQQATQSVAAPLQQQMQHFNGMTPTSQGPMFTENYQPAPMHHTMPPSMNNQVPQPLPPSQHYPQIYSLYPSGGHIMSAPNTVQYITSGPGPVPVSGHGPNHTHAQFPMLIHSTSSTPPMTGPGPGA